MRPHDALWLAALKRTSEREKHDWAALYCLIAQRGADGVAPVVLESADGQVLRAPRKCEAAFELCLRHLHGHCTPLEDGPCTVGALLADRAQRALQLPGRYVPTPQGGVDEQVGEAAVEEIPQAAEEHVPPPVDEQVAPQLVPAVGKAAAEEPMPQEEHATHQGAPQGAVEERAPREGAEEHAPAEEHVPAPSVAAGLSNAEEVFETDEIRQNLPCVGSAASEEQEGYVRECGSAAPRRKRRRITTRCQRRRCWHSASRASRTGVERSAEWPRSGPQQHRPGRVLAWRPKEA